MVASWSSLGCSGRKKPVSKLVSCREAKGLVTALSCPRFVTYNTVIHCVKDLDYRISIVLSVVTRDCCKPTNNCGDRVLSNSELEVGPPAFQLPMLENLTQCRKEFFSTCFSKESIPAIPFLDLEACTPYQKLEAPESGSPLHQLCIMVASCPSLGCSGRKKPVSKQVSCREAKGLVTALSSPRFVTCNTVIHCVKDLDYRISIVLSVVTRDCCKPMTTCQNWVLSNSELEVGPPAFELPSLKTSSMPKRVLFDMFV